LALFKIGLYSPGSFGINVSGWYARRIGRWVSVSLLRRKLAWLLQGKANAKHFLQRQFYYLFAWGTLCRVETAKRTISVFLLLFSRTNIFSTVVLDRLINSRTWCHDAWRPDTCADFSSHAISDWHRLHAL